MKKLYNIFYLILLSMLFFTACQDDDLELGAMLDKSAIDYEVTQDYTVDEGGNTVILRNLTPETVAMWDYGTGRSNRMTDTVRFPFKGEYTIQFSAVTAGGVVAMDPITIDVTEDNLMYVSDPLWLALTGGPGEEKSWVLDTEEKYFAGPLSFYGTNNGWLLEGGPWNEGAEETGCYGGDCWTWSPDAGWIFDNAMAAGDYGVMTFSLEGGPYFSATKPMEEGIEEKGTYYLDVNSKMLTINDASILRGYKPAKDGLAGISNWSNYTVFALDENILRLGVVRDNDVDGEGVAMLVYNFISKEYSDNWVPEETGDPNFDHGDQSEILAVNTSKTWHLDLEVPYNWTSLEGEMLNNWNSRADIMATGWAPYGDADVESIDNASIQFFQDGRVIVSQDDGSSEEGTYTIKEDTNIIEFSEVMPSIPIAGWVTATTTAENEWKIVKVEETIAGEITGIWLGQRAVDKGEYMVFHFVQR